MSIASGVAHSFSSINENKICLANNPAELQCLSSELDFIWSYGPRSTLRIVRTQFG